MAHILRSKSIVSVSLLIAMTALAGCKGGGGDSDASTSSISNSTSPTGGSTSTNPSNPPVASDNRAPTITGTAPSVAATNAAYAFAPTASDADGDQLTFQIQNKPNWATFNTVSGQLSGTPTLSQAGVYSNVVITASDGRSSASLPAFSITVASPAPIEPDGATTLSWQAPTENTDGSALTDLGGFVILYGPSSTTLTQSVRVENPSVSTYVFQDLPAGTHFFAIKAFTRSGAESALSGAVSKTIG